MTADTLAAVRELGMVGLTVFVWTLTGQSPHIADVASSTTLCGRPVDRWCDAHDALWFQVCAKCQRSIGLEPARP